MLKLTKYEFRKNRTLLIIFGIGLILLQVYFMVSTSSGDDEHTIISSMLLFTYLMVCYFSVFMLAISSYSKELNSKSSYLIFMTPNSALKIILSKMLTILIMGIVLLILVCTLGYFDISMILDAYPNVGTIAEFFDEMMYILGINTNQLIISIFASVLRFIISFFSIVTLAYLSITLSATLLQNNKLKGLVSFVIFIALSYLISFFSNMLPYPYSDPQNVLYVLISTLPVTIFNMVIMIASIIGCSILLEKKVSL
ncbi:MAG: hypothetical protein HFH63_00190 [Lachnospiraceae bacterium]|nr:hypothetical protein [Lachnospiraceae bacterium]